MRNLLPLTLLVLTCSCDSGKDCCPNPKPDDKALIKGVDISFLPEMEDAGIKFFSAAGTEHDMLDILQEHDVNTVRLRIWHSPVSGHSSLAEVKTFSDRIKAKGMKVWLTVHYSDTWADPGHQEKPQAWNTASFTDLQDSVYKYTKKIMTQIDPDIIQIGNEINGGFLFPDGATSNVSNFVALLKKGVQAVREASPETKIMIHLAGFNEAIWLYQQLATNNVDYDMIGLSYYPIWHGKILTTVQSTINTLGATYGKEVVIAETAYPFSLLWNDDETNIVGESGQLVVGYPATPIGQKNFLLKIRQMVTDSPNGAGFCYWGAEWVAFAGNVMEGSSWENQALFDFNNKATPAWEAFEE